jgi:hypothetical protein
MARLHGRDVRGGRGAAAGPRPGFPVHRRLLERPGTPMDRIPPSRTDDHFRG